MKKMKIILFSLLILSAFPVVAQTFINDDDFPVNGYSKKISGLDFDYHWCIPGLRESILIRATGGKDFMEWETEPLPGVKDKSYAAVI